MFRCYGCSPPDDPPHGSWDCDLLKNGDTVCMLQCEVYNRECWCSLSITNIGAYICLQIGFTIKGKHIIQCQGGENEFPHSSSASSCQPISNHIVEYDEDDNFENTQINMNMTIIDKKPIKSRVLGLLFEFSWWIYLGGKCPKLLQPKYGKWSCSKDNRLCTLKCKPGFKTPVTVKARSDHD